eukprot:3842994-Alexandrium_andersonii.AAC.1
MKAMQAVDSKESSQNFIAAQRLQLKTARSLKAALNSACCKLTAALKTYVKAHNAASAQKSAADSARS